MRPFRILLVGVAAMVIGGAAWIYAQQKPASGTLSPQDYIDIYQLYGYYTRDVEPGSERNAAWLFTEDGSFESPTGEIFKGQRQLQEFYEPRRYRVGLRHLNTNFLIHPTREGARGTAYMIMVEQEQERPIEVTTFGVYHDTFVKTRAGWRFKERAFRMERPRGK